MRINRKPSALVIVIVVAIALLTIGSVVALVALAGTGGGMQVELEDCDAEDRRNREKECGFVQPAKTTKPAAPAKTPAKQQPAPRITRR